MQKKRKGAKVTRTIRFDEDDENSYKRTPLINKVYDPPIESNPRKEDTIPTVDPKFQHNNNNNNNNNNNLDQKRLFLSRESIVPCPRDINIVQPSSSSPFELLSLSTQKFKQPLQIIIDDNNNNNNDNSNNNNNNNGELTTDLTLRLFPIWEPSNEDEGENDELKFTEIEVSSLDTKDKKIMSCMDPHHDFVPYYEFL